MEYDHPTPALCNYWVRDIHETKDKVINSVLNPSTSEAKPPGSSLFFLTFASRGSIAYLIGVLRAPKPVLLYVLYISEMESVVALSSKITKLLSVEGWV